jgi:hypothetical protein
LRVPGGSRDGAPMRPLMAQGVSPLNPTENQDRRWLPISGPRIMTNDRQSGARVLESDPL